MAISKGEKGKAAPVLKYFRTTPWTRMGTSVLAGGEWSASRPYRFTHGERDPVPIG
jgi:hypothetical protein